MANAHKRVGAVYVDRLVFVQINLSTAINASSSRESTITIWTKQAKNEPLVAGTIFQFHSFKLDFTDEHVLCGVERGFVIF